MYAMHSGSTERGHLADNHNNNVGYFASTLRPSCFTGFSVVAIFITSFHGEAMTVQKYLDPTR